MRTQRTRTSIHASGQGSQALPSIQPPLHLISLVNTQLIVTLAHLSPPAHLDLRCCSSFLSAPFIADLHEIVSTATVSRDYNVSLLQRSQLPWLFLIARHFCDKLVD